MSPRHLTVLEPLSEGKTMREIARTTGLATETVKSYLSEIYRALGARNRAEAVAVAIRRGLL